MNGMRESAELEGKVGVFKIILLSLHYSFEE